MKPINISGVAIGDLNGDGRPDIGVALSDIALNYTLQELIGNGDGTFRQGPPPSAPGDGGGIAMADFNRDTRPDLATAMYGEYRVSVLINPGNGTPGAAVTLATRSAPVGIAAGDLNGDGAADLVTSNSYPRGEVCVWLGDGAGGFHAPIYSVDSNDPGATVIADLDGDGHPDLASSDFAAGTVSVLFGDGTGKFGVPPSVGVPDAPASPILALRRIQPNPVRAQATIRFSLPSAGRATLRVLDAAGRLVATVEDGFLPAGEHVTVWDGRGPDGAQTGPRPRRALISANCASRAGRCRGRSRSSGRRLLHSGAGPWTISRARLNAGAVAARRVRGSEAGRSAA